MPGWHHRPVSDFVDSAPGSTLSNIQGNYVTDNLRKQCLPYCPSPQNRKSEHVKLRQVTAFRTPVPVCHDQRARWARGLAWLTASRSPTTGPARASRSPSRTGASRPGRCGSSIPTSSSTTPPSCRRPPAGARSPTSTVTTGILRYRGYPIQDLAEQSTYLEVAYLLAPRRAARPGAVREVDARHHVPHLRPRERPEAVHGRLPPRRPPDGHPGGDGGGAVDLLPRGQEHRRPRGADDPGQPAHRQDADPGRLRPPLLGRAARSSSPTTRSTSRRTSCR